MQLHRRAFLHLVAAGAACFTALSPNAYAQSYPTRSVHIIVGFPAGGTADIVSRLVGQCLSEKLNQQFVIENRPGAGTNIATETVVRATPDGYTLLAAASTNTINPAFYSNLNFNFVRDITMVSGISRQPLVLDVHPSVPLASLPELIAYAKANPGQISMASFGTGTTSQAAIELFKMMADVSVLHVPYHGSAPMITDLLAGRVQTAIDALPTSLEQIRAGKLRALAMTTATRSEALPDVPTVSEFLPGYEVVGWVGVGAPAKTPAQVVNKLNKEINTCLGDPRLLARLAQLGATAFVRSPGELAALVVEETEKWAKVTKFAGIAPQ